MRPWLATMALVLLLVAGCAPRVDPEAVVLWTAFEGPELSTLQRVIEQYKSSRGAKVELLKVPFSGLKQKMLVAGPAGQGPDLLISPHDWIGQLCIADLLAPIPDDLVGSDFYDIAKRCATYNRDIYALPLNLDCLVMARNTSLCPQKPTNLDQLVELAKKSQDSNPGVLGFAYDLSDFYFTGAFLEGFGADFLSPFRQEKLDLDKLNFATPAGIAGATWVFDIGKGHKYDLVPLDMKNSIALELFTRGKLALMICGPWNLGDIRTSGVPYQLSPLPNGPAGSCSPFVGVTGVVLGKSSATKAGAKELLEYLASPEVTAKLCLAAGRAPARKDTAELLAKESLDPNILRDLKLLADAAQMGTPMPNHPAVGATFWSAMQGSFELIIRGQVTIKDELSQSTERVRAKIRFMTE